MKQKLACPWVFPLAGKLAHGPCAQVRGSPMSCPFNARGLAQGPCAQARQAAFALPAISCQLRSARACYAHCPPRHTVRLPCDVSKPQTHAALSLVTATVVCAQVALMAIDQATCCHACVRPGTHALGWTLILNPRNPTPACPLAAGQDDALPTAACAGGCAREGAACGHCGCDPSGAAAGAAYRGGREREGRREEGGGGGEEGGGGGRAEGEAGCGVGN